MLLWQCCEINDFVKEFDSIKIKGDLKDSIISQTFNVFSANISILAFVNVQKA